MAFLKESKVLFCFQSFIFKGVELAGALLHWHTRVTRLPQYASVFFIVFLWTIPLVSGQLLSPKNLHQPLLLQKAHFIYKGSFRVPKPNLVGQVTDNLSYTSGPIAYFKDRHTLFILTRKGNFIELNIPAVSAPFVSLESLPIATVFQPPYDITNHTFSNLLEDHSAISNGGSPGGLLVYKDSFQNTKLLGSAYAYYDASNQAYFTHYTAEVNWQNQPNFSGFFKVGLPYKAGFVAGYLAEIPALWQTIFQESFFTGQCCIPIISRTSFGPSLSTMSLSGASTTLLEYSSAHQTLGGYSDAPSLGFNRVTRVVGVIFPKNSLSIVFFGTQGLGQTGLGDTCYGLGTNILSQHNAVAPSLCGSILLTPGEKCCYDLVNASKGGHGYPYVNYIWMYGALELAAVKSGSKAPWEVLPYFMGEFPLPLGILGDDNLGSIAFDAITSTLYVLQYGVDRPNPQAGPYPVIHVYKVEG